LKHVIETFNIDHVFECFTCKLSTTSSETQTPVKVQIVAKLYHTVKVAICFYENNLIWTKIESLITSKNMYKILILSLMFL
jgi:hypothetical protein